MKRRFMSQWVHKVDQKGRVSVPADFRRALEQGDPDWTEGLNPTFVIYNRPEKRCLEGYSLQGMEKIDEMISSLPHGPARDTIERLIYALSSHAQVDENGRIVLSAKLRESVGIEAEALFVGMGDKFQIWAPDAFEADQAEIAARLEEPGRERDPFALLQQALREAKQ